MAATGDKKLHHCEVLKIKEIDYSGKGKSKKQIVIKYEYLNDFNSKMEMAEEKFFDGMYGLPKNASQKKALMSLLKGEETKFTLALVKAESGYWDKDANAETVQIGHVGKGGLQMSAPAQGVQSGAQSARPAYSNDGARAGMLLNNAVAIMVATGKKVTEDGLMGWAARLDKIAERIKVEVIGSPVEEPKVEQKEEKPKSEEKAKTTADDSDPTGGSSKAPATNDDDDDGWDDDEPFG